MKNRPGHNAHGVLLRMTGPSAHTIFARVSYSSELELHVLSSSAPSAPPPATHSGNNLLTLELTDYSTVFTSLMVSPFVIYVMGICLHVNTIDSLKKEKTL